MGNISHTQGMHKHAFVYKLNMMHRNIKVDLQILIFIIFYVASGFQKKGKFYFKIEC